MKKIRLISYALISLMALTACYNGGNGSSSEKKDSESLISSSQIPDSSKITLTYAAWNLGNLDDAKPNLERRMLQEFVAANPTIQVKIIERPIEPGTTKEQNWNEFLAARASIQKLPDVFYTDSIPKYIINNWVYDLTTIAQTDDEYNNLSQDVRKVAMYDNKVFALPNSIHYQGFMINKTLFEEQNVAYPTLQTNFNDFLSKIKRAANQKEGVTKPIAGINRIGNLIDWYPSLLNENYGWSTFDGTKFNFDSIEFKDAVDKYHEIYNDKSYCYESLSAEEKTAIFNDQWVYDKGLVLAEWDESFNFADRQKSMDSGRWDWEVDFIGIPAVNGKKVTPIVMDFMTVAKNTKYPQEAYKLAKWMGFGKDGYLKRLEIPKNEPVYDAVNYAPMQNDDELLDKFFEQYPSFTFFREIVESESFIVEPNKYLPGYNDARYDASYDSEMKMDDVFRAIMAGTIKLSDIAAQLNKKTNDIYKAEYDLLATKI